MSIAVLRRYTPPTCTLEISAVGSALSRWTDRQVMKNVRFALHFDDPRLPEQEQTTIRGDRFQLDILCEVVGTYVQQLLSPDAPELQPAVRSLLTEGIPQRHDLELVGTLPGLSTQNGTVIPLMSPPAVASSNSLGVALEPHGLLSHALHLGSLSPDESRSVVYLRVTQLFDLANALDSYTGDALVLPDLARPAWSRSPKRWLPVAAGLVLAVGVTVSLTRFISGLSAPQVASAPAAGTMAAPEAAQNSIGVSPTLPPGGATLPTVPSDALSVPPSPPAGALSPGPQGFPSPLPQQPLQPIVPGQNVPRSPLVIPPPASLGPDQSISPPTLPVPVNPSIAQRPTMTVPVPPSAARVPNPPQPGQFPTVPRDGEIASVSELGPATLAAPAESSRASAPSSNGPAAATARGSSDAASPTDPAPGATITIRPNLPSIPQVQQAQEYFQQRWQPQPGIEQTLEYRLVVAPDGTIAQILPLGEVAGASIDRTGMPLTGDPFVTPIENGKTVLIRVVLSPDGEVQTFLEGTN